MNSESHICFISNGLRRPLFPKRKYWSFAKDGTMGLHPIFTFEPFPCPTMTMVIVVYRNSEDIFTHLSGYLLEFMLTDAAAVLFETNRYFKPHHKNNLPEKEASKDIISWVNCSSIVEIGGCSAS